MSAPAATHDNDDRRRRGTRRMLAIAAIVIVGVLLAANAHLVYVAFSSQPDCVAHLKGEGDHGTYRAAKSAC
ncbi:hypothetical protein [Devosia ginsengisoli]|uniref:hypothetical protein n=1 Tax=Devosia ginsengisoli TaxID=400770 RepID=UPI0026F32F2B|nr:hypothetical protein [Devosia ginsengisoli]MCR6670573.1 hypothetical protein [Devosia ginsengisoli]